MVSFDAKINFDDNASFRQKDVFSLDDTTESDQREVEASKHNLNYIGMDGNIGCLGETATIAVVLYILYRFSYWSLLFYYVYYLLH